VKLPLHLREQLKTPLGVLILDDDVTKQNISNYVDEESLLITVGDRTTEKMIKFGFFPFLQIIDGQEKRVKRKPPDSKVLTELSCNNPPAEITLESIDLIRRSFSSKPPIRITVTGEEDLLVIPVCIYAPENSVVMYGQPNQGLVVTLITPEIKNKAQNLLDSME